MAATTRISPGYFGTSLLKNEQVFDDNGPLTLTLTLALALRSEIVRRRFYLPSHGFSLAFGSGFAVFRFTRLTRFPGKRCRSTALHGASRKTRLKTPQHLPNPGPLEHGSDHFSRFEDFAAEFMREPAVFLLSSRLISMTCLRLQWQYVCARSALVLRCGAAFWGLR